ncbi:sugar transporter [Aspergillus luchuensis]|uniref:Sugar transporter n=1 Tax=Aspergillus kawachii TaxID=1069201 RepID=A0A146F2Y5_ASPKA|nr:sugar transporter [Aspergillus luchuensis]
MPFGVNPFRKNDHDFPGVVVPLSEAPPHHKPNPELEKTDRPDEKTDNRSLDRAPSSEAGVGSVHNYNTLTIEALRAEVEADIATSGKDTAYDRKAKLINRAIQDIGMGRYQWQLFALCGFGWLADKWVVPSCALLLYQLTLAYSSLWLQGVALTLTPIASEFGVSTTWVRFTTCSLFLGLCIGASFWGIASDIIGRRPAFNMTLFICGVFGIAAGGAPTWIGLLAWAFIPDYSCSSDLPACGNVASGEACCTKQSNMGWRYLCFTLGALTFAMFICRFFLFHLYESPKYLLARGRQSDAVASVHGIAHKNRTKTWLTEEILNEIGGYPEEVAEEKLSFAEIVRRNLSKFSLERIGPLFSSKKLGFSTVLLWFCWATIGMGYPLFNAFLPQYLERAGGSSSSSTYIAYRNYAITSIVGVPGSILACYTVEIKYVGRKGTMVISTLITGVLLFCFTASTDSNIQLLCSCLEAFFQNIMYGVLYAYTPEVFPAPNRGTATGISSCLNRIAGLCAPLVAIYGASSNPDAPIYASGGLILAAFVAMCLLPIETRGKQTL